MANAKSEVVVVGRELVPLVRVSQQLVGASYAVSIVQAPRPIEHLLQRAPPPPEAIVVSLTGSENVVEVRSLFEVYPGTCVLLLAPDFPPRPAIARIVGRGGGIVLSQRESSLTVAASLMALIYQKRAS